MKIKELISSWESTSRQSSQNEKYHISLPLKDAARIEALTGLYPGLNKNQILSQLISVALDEVERQMPYKAGNKVVGLDELGDPLYEDVGPTPKYLELRHAFAKGFNKRKAS